MADSRQVNTKMPNQKAKHPPKDAEKPDVGETDRMGEDDQEGAGADMSMD